MVDLYYPLRVNNVKIEEFAKSIQKLIKDGLIRGWDY